MGTDLTKHATYRMKQRNIPKSLIYETINRGQRTILPDRRSVEYKIKNVLGIRGVNLVVVTSVDGVIITCYVDRLNKKKHRR